MSAVDLNSETNACPRLGVVYRNEEEFNNALDAAADNIQPSLAMRIAGTAFALLLVVMGALYAADFVFHWPIRRTLISGVSLTAMIWFVVILLAFVLHGLKRDAHTRILRKRLCFTCGTSLLDVKLNDEHGLCPSCTAGFSLAQYRRPSENRGRSFGGYIDEQHFTAAMQAAGERIRIARGAGLEKTVHDWLWLALFLSFLIKVFFGRSLFDSLPGQIPWHVAWLGLLLFWGFLWHMRIQMLQKWIPEKRLCLACGYSLLNARLDAGGYGRCPECASEFCEREWEPPLDAPAVADAE